MPVTGRPPKAPGQAVTRHAQQHDWIEIEDVPFEGGPALDPEAAPACLPGWPRRTLAKWEAWRTMPHCGLWGPAEWDYALDSIAIAAMFHATGEQKYATELRNREKVIGTTMDFRRALRIRYVEPKAPDAGAVAGVANLADYRDL
ncbi:hypothetical protein DS6A_1 [Mycobacterium phage DS6A]|uniref:Terminase small subunit n=1 Tax=Mycobacterium phage DS6A TaxID=45764 RepID=G8I4B1_9CAUD|nr:hypothetical protein DS6A_1 [Mycobacterium phage DS6A]AER47555.1 hypothetical protein DS6A_1 [Mycobacterium phage DS6A]